MTSLPTLTFDDIKAVGLTYIKPVDWRLVESAYKLAAEAHKDQVRKSGEPYIQHPLHVALILAQLGLDPATLAAAFLHDVVEDTPNTVAMIRRRFGWRIGTLVDGVTKLEVIEHRPGFFEQLLRSPQSHQQPHALNKTERRIETLRKLFLATSKDVRVVLIKLADRLHNMETLVSIEPKRQVEIAQETLEIYAPIAYRLGIGTIKGRLEDLAFPYVMPKEYRTVVRLIKREAIDREAQVKKVRRILMKLLATHGIKSEIHARVKHLYSLYRKLERYNHDISKIYDVVACRIIVNSVEECYQVLGLIHQRWKPYDDRVKDYIATPKSNGYQSLHTTVRAVSDRPIEIQIRTQAMHEQAEFGVAAHWRYSEQKGTLNYLRKRVTQASSRELNWVSALVRWQRQARSYQDFDQLMKIDFFGDRVFAYTPRGEVIDLPIGSTPVDFAYTIHSEIGNHLAGAKVNGKMTKLDQPLKTGDVVEILVQTKLSPKADWLTFVKTSQAKSHIRRSLRDKTAGIN